MNDYKEAALCVIRYRQIMKEVIYEFRQEMKNYIEGDFHDYIFITNKPIIWCPVAGEGEKGDIAIVREKGVEFVEEKV